MLPWCVIRWVVCAVVFLEAVGQETSSSSPDESPRCPGRCVPLDEPCEQTGIDFCGKGLKCCTDNTQSSTMESTEASELFTFNPDVENEMRFRSFLDPETAEESTRSPLSTMVYEEAFGYSSPDNGDLPDSALKCAGMCMSLPESNFCGHPFPFAGLCSENQTCCLNELQAFKIKLLSQRNASGEGGISGNAEIRRIFQEGSFGDLSRLYCAYNCIPPRYFRRCTLFYPDYFCPGNSQCCVEDVSKGVEVDDTCEGRCIPPHVQYLCRDPRVLRPSSSCRPPTLCCEQSSRWQHQYPSHEGEEHGILERSAQPEDLSGLPPIEGLSPDETYMIADDEGTPWEEGTQISIVKSRSYFGDAEDPYRVTPVFERPASDEILIPDEEEQQAPKKTDVAARPPCPGSCMSYPRLTKYLCSGNYTPYDGFYCPARSTCCAKVEDVKKHEEYLRSIYPYLQSNLKSLNPNCGKKGRREETDESLPGEWCWQVAIVDSSNRYICGGVLIDKMWALTTAQCVARHFAEDLTLFVRAGITDLTSDEDNAVSQTRRISNLYLHYRFDASTLDNDIALLKLQNPLNFNANVCLVCLPSRSVLPDEGTMCTVTGFAFLSRSQAHFEMKEAKVPVVGDLDCIATYTGAFAMYILPASSFCVGSEKDYCQGSGGNPFVCKVDDYYELMGLFSWGLSCDVGGAIPGVFVKIPVFMGWINHVMAIDHQLQSAAPNVE